MSRGLPVLGVCAALAAFAMPAHAATTATVTATLSPDRLGANGAVSVTIAFSDPAASLPAPVRSATLRFPAGLTLEVPHLSSCSEARLEALGTRACPAASGLGRGRAVVAGYIGSQLVAENVSLRLYLGPLNNLQPTVEVFGEGLSPIAEQVVLDGLVFADAAPYGERLVLTIPPIATVPPAPDASITSFSLTVGANGSERRNRATVHVPKRCPSRGFPIVAEFAYADGSGGSARAAIPCPPRTHRKRDR
ncbi:MAG TPA: hypothetical protein VL988_01815 [Solirubrobacteraceae bacterium]|nr:hypothetical protein [Solirubrobacteraceae bacterium]